MRSVVASLLGGSCLLVDELVEQNPVGDGPTDYGAVPVHSGEQVDVEAEFRGNVAEGDADQARQHHSSCDARPPTDPENGEVDTPVHELNAAENQL